MTDKPLLLVVEDEPDLLELFTTVLTEAGYRVETAADYSTGAVLLSASSPALLIANMLLPGGDGRQLAELASRSGIPTLLVSGDSAAAVPKQRGVAFLSKPFRAADLHRAIAELLRGI
jgi:DNA-binding response OmpR family regulator